MKYKSTVHGQPYNQRGVESLFLHLYGLIVAYEPATHPVVKRGHRFLSLSPPTTKLKTSLRTLVTSFWIEPTSSSPSASIRIQALNRPSRRAMATPTPTLHIKSAARKLPIKRKTPSHQSSQTLLSPVQNPNPNPNPNPNSLDLSTSKTQPESYAIPVADDGEEDDGSDEEVDEEEEEGSEGGGEVGSEIIVSEARSGDLKPPPFKFHRIWSESDEIRFLQGLLGCWSQGLVFPRDLNLFYDRFLESMPQPYTRSQLSEKLRRLRKKFRVMSARIARGQDPSRLAPHDRDLLHLCTRLWHPSYASSSPFSSTDAASTGTSGNKRRRPNPRAPTARSRAVAIAASGSLSPPHPPPPQLPPAPPQALPAPTALTATAPTPADGGNLVAEPRLPAESVGGKGEKIRYLASKTVLDVFDGSLEELRMTLLRCPDQTSNSDLSKRWQGQRVAELDVLARRLRLVLEQALSN